MGYFSSNAIIPLPAVSKRIHSIGYSIFGMGTRTYVLLESHDREKGLEARVARRNENIAIICTGLDGGRTISKRVEQDHVSTGIALANHARRVRSQISVL
jgi:hypothetical protein